MKILLGLGRQLVLLSLLASCMPSPEVPEKKNSSNREQGNQQNPNPNPNPNPSPNPAPSNAKPMAVGGTYMIEQGLSLQIQMMASDADGDQLLYQFVDLNPQIGIIKDYSPFGGTFTFEANKNVAGIEVVRFKVSDGKEDSEVVEISIQVKNSNVVVPPPNAAPTITNALYKVQAGASIKVQLLAADADNDPLTYTLLTANPNLGVISNFNSSTGEFNYNAKAGSKGLDLVQFKVSDGKAESNVGLIQFEVEELVAPNNKPGVAPAIYKIVAGEQVQVQLVASDPDNDPLTFQLVNPNPVLGSILSFDQNTGILLYQANQGVEGTESILFKANDGKEDSVNALLTIQIMKQEQIAENNLIKTLPEQVKLFTNGELAIKIDGGTPPYSFTSLDDGMLKGQMIGPQQLLLQAEAIEGQVDFIIVDGANTQKRFTLSVQAATVALTNDEALDVQWGLHNTDGFVPEFGKVDADIDAAEAWSLYTDCSGVPVAVIDSGVDVFHPDLAVNILRNMDEIPNNNIDDDNNGLVDDYYGYDFNQNDNDVKDDNGHGTHVAGIIGAVGNNAQGVSGVCHTAEIIPVKVFDENGNGSLSDIYDGIIYAVDRGAIVLNNSYGVSYDDPQDPEGLQAEQLVDQAIQYSRERERLFIAAAGNSSAFNDQILNIPANSKQDNVMSVAATSIDDRLASFSNFGTNTVHIGAPGDYIAAPLPTGQAVLKTQLGLQEENIYYYLSGTSMAAPMVAGAATLLWANSPGRDYKSVKQKLLDSSENLNDLAQYIQGNGRRLNLQKAFEK
jgi:subtilisin family serine protease